VNGASSSGPNTEEGREGSNGAAGEMDTSERRESEVGGTLNPCGLVLCSAAAVSVPRGIWRLENGLGERGEGGRRRRARAQVRSDSKNQTKYTFTGIALEMGPAIHETMRKLIQGAADQRVRRCGTIFSQHDSFAAHSRQFYADRSADTPPRGSRTRDQSICRRVESPRCRQATHVENGRRDHYLAMGKRKVGVD